MLDRVSPAEISVARDQIEAGTAPPLRRPDQGDFRVVCLVFLIAILAVYFLVD
ncbi:hypothetical protein [Alsobacter metallidurans]|uniref:hypothetical protein n=1 Tax=Alsobacter metallidurans TaxID=340221 RepID=UPI00166E2FE5|nr:hypothetical protein [Alsobacter metallidurans]